MSRQNESAQFAGCHRRNDVSNGSVDRFDSRPVGELFHPAIGENPRVQSLKKKERFAF
ncbi:MAG: hypothetical protein U0T82_10030 [Bacteroidales bacterium]